MTVILNFLWNKLYPLIVSGVTWVVNSIKKYFADRKRDAEQKKAAEEYKKIIEEGGIRDDKKREAEKDHLNS